MTTTSVKYKGLSGLSPGSHDLTNSILGNDGQLAQRSTRMQPTQPTKGSLDSRNCLQEQQLGSCVHDSRDSSRNSPSILDSSKSTATFRELPGNSVYVSEFRRIARTSSINSQPRISGECSEPIPTYEDGREASFPSFDILCPESPRHTFDGGDAQVDLIESLKELAKIQEATQTFADGGKAPRSSPDVFTRESHGFPQQAPRSSSFDYKEALRVSQRVNEAPRHSLDSRETPRSVLDLRRLIQSRLDGLDLRKDPAQGSPDVQRSAAVESGRQSIPTSFRASSNKESLINTKRNVPNVVARLMGLDDFPDLKNAPKSQSLHRKPSKEAKLLQGLLQCKPFPDSQRQSTTSSERDVNLQHRIHQAAHLNYHSESLEADQSVGHYIRQANQEARPNDQSEETGRMARRELQSIFGQMEERCDRPQDITVSPEEVQKQARVSVPSIAMPHGRMPIAQRKRVDASKPSLESRPTVLNESRDEMGVQQGISFQEEIEKRLRKLGSQSYEHERKTLKQILEGMRLKGLLHNPPLNHAHESDLEVDSGDRREESVSPPYIEQQRHSGGRNQRLMKFEQDCHFQLDPSTSIRPSIGILHQKQSQNTNGHVVEAPIVIMKPRSKSPNRINLQEYLSAGEWGNLNDIPAVSCRPPKVSQKQRMFSTGQSSGSFNRSVSRRNKDIVTLKPRKPMSTKDVTDRTSLEKKQDTGNEWLLSAVQSAVRYASLARQGYPYGQSPKKMDDIKIMPQQDFESVVKKDGFKIASKVIDINQILSEHRVRGISQYEASETRSSDIEGSRFSESQPIVKNVGSGNTRLEVQSPLSLDLNRTINDPQALTRANPKDGDGSFSGELEQQQALTDLANSLHDQHDREACENSGPKSPIFIHGSKFGEGNKELVEVANDGQDDDKVKTHESESSEVIRFPLITKVEEDTNEGQREESGPVSMLDRPIDNGNSLKTATTCSNSYGGELCTNDSDCLLHRRDGPPPCCTSKSTTDIRFNWPRQDFLIQNVGFDINPEKENWDEAHTAGGEATEFKYVQEILNASGAMDNPFSIITKWHCHGYAINSDLYSKLEEKWEGVKDRDLETHELAKDKDFGGELYRKSRQEACRRRLLFDCVNDVLIRHLSCTTFAGQISCLAKLRCRRSMTGVELVEKIWKDLQSLSCMRSDKAQDDIHIMMERDIAQCVDRWSDHLGADQAAQLGIYLEELIYTDLVDEFLAEMSSQT